MSQLELREDRTRQLRPWLYRLAAEGELVITDPDDGTLRLRRPGWPEKRGAIVFDLVDGRWSDPTTGHSGGGYWTLVRELAISGPVAAAAMAGSRP